MSNSIHHVAVIGTGLIGISWVTHFLSKGLEVTASDPAPGAEDRLKAGIASNDPNLSLERLRFSKDPVAAVKNAQFVQENGPERIEVKKELFKQLDAATDPLVILASSSSGIAVSDFQINTIHPERILLGHPFNPPHLIPLVEVCGGKLTSEQAIVAAIEFYESMGKKTIRLHKEMKGHVANRLQAALWQEAFYLLQEGVASAEDIDRAISEGPGLRWAILGPFLNLHLSGGSGGIQHMLEHLGPPMESWMESLGKVSIDEKLTRLVSAEVTKFLESKDITQITEGRNHILKQLLKLKEDTKSLA